MKFYYAFSAAFRTAPQGLRQGLYRLKVAPWKESDGTSADVRFGSKADMCSAKRHVRFTPESGHSPSFDHLVGAAEKRWRHAEAERLGGFQIDDQFEFGRLHYRQVGGLGAFQDLVHIDSSAAVHVGFRE